MAMTERTSNLLAVKEALERNGRHNLYPPLRVMWLEIGTNGAYIENHIELRALVGDLALELASATPDRSAINSMLDRIASGINGDKRVNARVKAASDSLRSEVAAVL